MTAGLPAPKPERRWWGAVFIIALLVGLAWLWLARGSIGSRTPAVGRPAPDFTLTTSTGDTLRLHDLRGQAVLLNFWASWCGPCRWEMPALQAVYEEHREHGLLVVAVNQGDSEKEVSVFIHDLSLTFPVALDDDWKVGDLYGIRALPTSFFVDRDGIVRAIVVGALSRSLLESNLRNILPSGQREP